MPAKQEHKQHNPPRKVIGHTRKAGIRETAKWPFITSENLQRSTIYLGNL